MDEYPLRVPAIGTVITPEYAWRLAMWRGLNDVYLAILKNEDKFRPFRFDGCSCLPDNLFDRFCDWSEKVLPCCLDHDLRYYVGREGNDDGKLVADMLFYDGLVDNGVPKWIAQVFFEAVKIGGAIPGTSFRYGFGRK